MRTWALLLILVLPALSGSALAGTIEISGGFNFSRANYGEGSFTWNRRWGASVGYYLGDKTEVEISFQDIVDRSLISGVQDTTFHDQVYGANWVQSFTGRNFPVQPYTKLGIGQLERKATGSYTSGARPPASLGSLTGIMGAGLRIYLTRAFAIRTEATTYLQGANISTWKDNFGFTAGISFMY